MAEELATTKANDLANVTEQNFNRALEIGRSLKSSFISLKKDNLAKPQLIQDILHEALSNNKNIVSIWSVWEPNTINGTKKDSLNFCGKSGYWDISYVRQNNKIKANITEIDKTSDLYNISKNSKKRSGIEPLLLELYRKR